MWPRAMPAHRSPVARWEASALSSAPAPPRAHNRLTLNLPPVCTYPVLPHLTSTQGVLAPHAVHAPTNAACKNSKDTHALMNKLMSSSDKPVHALLRCQAATPGESGASEGNQDLEDAAARTRTPNRVPPPQAGAARQRQHHHSPTRHLQRQARPAPPRHKLGGGTHRSLCPHAHWCACIITRKRSHTAPCKECPRPTKSREHAFLGACKRRHNAEWGDRLQSKNCGAQEHLHCAAVQYHGETAVARASIQRWERVLRRACAQGALH